MFALRAQACAYLQEVMLMPTYELLALPPEFDQPICDRMQETTDRL